MAETNWRENYATRVSNVFLKITVVVVKMSDPDISMYCKMYYHLQLHLIKYCQKSVSFQNFCRKT